MNTKIHQFLVRDVLALLKEGNTAYFICYNIAVLMIPIFEKDYYEQWQEYKESNFGNLQPEFIKSGFHVFSFCHHILEKGMHLEISVFRHLEDWMLRHFNEHDVCNLSYLNFIANQKCMTPRELRISLLEKVVEENPDAMFNIRL